MGPVLGILRLGLQRYWTASAALFGIGGAAATWMQKLSPLFFQSRELKVDAGLVPAERAADFLRGFAAAII